MAAGGRRRRAAGTLLSLLGLLAGGLVAAGAAAPASAAGPAPVNTVRPKITGTAVTGQTLSVSAGTWNPAADSYRYDWQACDPTSSTLSCRSVGTDQPTLTLSNEESGERIRVRVTATNTAGSARVNTSQTGAVTAPTGPPPTNTAAPTISGAPAAGVALTASPGRWSGTPTRYDYVWQSCTDPAPGQTRLTCVDRATSSGPTGQFTPGAELNGSRIRVHVTATSAAGRAVAQSARTRPVGTPTNTADPTLTLPTRSTFYAYTNDPAGPRVGDTLSTTAGTWAGEQATYTYVWQACENAVAGKDTCTTISDDPTATLEPDALGKTIRVLVTATNTLGATSKASDLSVRTLPASYSGANDTTFRATSSYGQGNVCAVTRYGNARCFGPQYGFYDRALRGVEGVVSVAADFNSVCALTTGSGLHCWSPDGNDEPVEAVVPTEVQDARSVQLFGGYGACAVTAGDEVFCWVVGSGESWKPFGDLKVTTFEADPNYSMCVIATDKTVRCASGGNVYTPADLGPVKSLTQIQEGRICAITSSDHARCWDPYSGDEDPAMPADLGTVKFVSAMGDNNDGSFAGCAVTTAGTLRCWGNLPGPVPDDLADGTVDVETISIAPGVSGVACALTSSGQARCWGEAFGYGFLSPQELETVGPLQSVTVTEFGPVCYLPTGAGLFCTSFANFDGPPLG